MVVDDSVGRQPCFEVLPAAPSMRLKGIDGGMVLRVDVSERLSLILSNIIPIIS